MFFFIKLHLLKFLLIKLHLMKFLLMKTSFGRWRHLKARFQWGEQRELPGLRLLPGNWGKSLLAQEMALTCFSLGFLCGSAGKESACNVRDLGSVPGLGRCPGEGKGYPLHPVFCPGDFHGLYSPRGCKESDVTDQLSDWSTQFLSLEHQESAFAIVMWILLPLGGNTEAKILGRCVRLGSLLSHTSLVGDTAWSVGVPQLERTWDMEFISLLLILILPLVVKFLVMEVSI